MQPLRVATVTSVQVFFLNGNKRGATDVYFQTHDPLAQWAANRKSGSSLSLRPSRPFSAPFAVKSFFGQTNSSLSQRKGSKDRAGSLSLANGTRFAMANPASAFFATFAALLRDLGG